MISKTMEISIHVKWNKSLIAEKQFFIPRRVCSWGTGQSLSADYVFHQLKSLLDKMSHVRIHDLQHMVGRLLLEDCVDINTVQDYLCHSQLSTTISIDTVFFVMDISRLTL